MRTRRKLTSSNQSERIVIYALAGLVNLHAYFQLKLKMEKMHSSDKLVKLKNLFSKFVNDLNDVTKMSCSSENGNRVTLSMEPFDRNSVTDFEFVNNTEQTVGHPQTIQETLAHCRVDIAPKLISDSSDLTWNGRIDSVVENFPRSYHSSNTVVPQSLEADNIVCCRYQHQKIQETLDDKHRSDVVQKFGDQSIRLNWAEDIVRDAETFALSQWSFCVTPNIHVKEIASARNELPGLRYDEEPDQKQGKSNQQNNFEEGNMSNETDDCDEEMFKNFVECSKDLEDIEYSEGQNNLASIIETLAERKSHDTSSLRNDEGAAQCELTSDEPVSGSELSAIRLNGSIDNTKMYVGTSDQKGKKLCCPFCYKLVCKLSRHIETLHKDEPEVQKLAAMPKVPEFKKERWIIQNAMKNAGLMKWNTEKTINSTGLLIVPRRPHPTLGRKATDFLICPNCISFHTITNLRNHFKGCTHGAFKGARNIKILARVIEGRSSSEASEQLRGVIPVMREDEVVQLIRYDWLLVAYGNILCMKYHYHYQQNMIRAKLRLAGRVLQALKVINSEVTDFASIFHPKFYKSLIEAIKVVGKFDSATNDFGAPATAASALTSVKEIGRLLKCEYIEKGESQHVTRTNDFIFLMESQFSSIINKRVRESQLKKKREKDHKIPSKEDVRLLSVFVKRERNICLEELSAKFCKEKWENLSKLTIASIIVFNRRRTGESQNILISDFHHRETINETSNEELFASLSVESKKVAERYSRMKVRGKRGFNVNVLLDADVMRCIELLLSHRLEAGVPPNNPFLFALPPPAGETRIRVVNACTVLASLSKMCGAKDPSTLRGTNLRKHFASACMAKELNDDMVGEVAKFMGHRESVHRENYRHNTIDREVVKIVKLLQEAQGISGDDDDDNDFNSSDNEEYVNIPMPDLRTVQKKCKIIDKNRISGTSTNKLKRDMNEAKPLKMCAPSITGSKSACHSGRKSMRSAGEKNSEKVGRQRKVETKKHPESKLSAVSASIAKQTGRKRTIKDHAEKENRKRIKIDEKKKSKKMN